MREHPRDLAARSILESLYALQSLATTTERARSHVAEVRAAGGVAALIDLLDETLCRSSWLLEWFPDLDSLIYGTILVLGEEHCQGGAAAGPFLSNEEAEKLRRMAAGESPPASMHASMIDVGEEGEEEEEMEEGEEEGLVEDNERRAAVAARLLERLA